MQRQFYTLDVFTPAAFAGNPLAVVLGADGLSAAQMQTVAREFNLIETVFVLEPRDPVNTARVRIFTPTRELPFAGHPTVGAAALIGHLRAPELIARQDISVVLEEQAGDVSCSVRHAKGKPLSASFDLPVAPAPAGEPASNEKIAAALGLPAADIGFDAHVPSVFSAGLPYHCVPLSGLAAMARIKPQAALWAEVFASGGHDSAYVYCRETAEAGHHFHARMFFPLAALVEDPATGSAAAALAGAIMRFGKPADGAHSLVLEQGYEMGRPSQIVLGLEVENGELTGASIGGATVIVTQGTIFL